MGHYGAQGGSPLGVEATPCIQQQEEVTAGARQHKQHFPLPYPFLCLRSLGYLFSPV